MKLNPADYKNIIFDFGGVIINLDYELTTQAFKRLGIDDFSSLFSKAKQNNLFDDYEKGVISSDKLRSELKKVLPPSTTNEQIDDAWNAMLLDLPNERLELLLKFKDTHQTYLLSNTNEIHINTFHSQLRKMHNEENLNNYFDKVYFSYKIGMRKPDAEIFEFVLNENNLIAEETLFIDDSIQHIEAANKLNINTHHLEVERESLMTLFNQ